MDVLQKIGLVRYQSQLSGKSFYSFGRFTLGKIFNWQWWKPFDRWIEYHDMPHKTWHVKRLNLLNVSIEYRVR